MRVVNVCDANDRSVKRDEEVVRRRRRGLTLPVPSAAKAAIGARKGRTAAGMTRFFRGEDSFFMDYQDIK